MRRAVVVENIGRVSAICSDKTGTLTEGRLHLTDALPAEGVPEKELLHVDAIAELLHLSPLHADDWLLAGAARLAAGALAGLMTGPSRARAR